VNFFTTEELVPYIGIIAFITVTLVANYRKSFMHFWSPMSILCIIFIYYTVIGPFWAISTDNTHDRLMNMRSFYQLAFWGAFINLLSFALGFSFSQPVASSRLEPRYNDNMLREYGIKLAAIGFVLFTISTGGNIGSLINPLDAEAVQQVGGSIGNYLALSLNFLIPAGCLLFLYYLRTRKNFLIFFAVLFVMVGIFVTLGFRYRLVLLFGALGISYFLYSGRRPNIVLSLVAFGVFVTLMGVINITRQYGSGLDTSRLQTKTDEAYYESGLRESLIFQTSGAMIATVPDKHPHAGFAPIISTILFPIPSALYPEKQSAQYLFGALDAIYGKTYSKGSAVMAFGEYYLAFGWFGIVIGGLVTGWLCRKLWNWYLSNPKNPLHICAYAISVSYLYVVVSRGYLPQVTMLFFFSVFPIVVIVWLIRRKYGYRSRPKPIPYNAAANHSHT
jgi:oligosaccharide repeat unit polymerase